MRYRFNLFELDTDQFCLQTNGGDIHVEPLVFDLLCFFVENAGQVLSREAIIQHVWQGRFVSDATVSSCVKSVRKVLGDSGENQTYIRTLRGRGFQFAASVEAATTSLDTVFPSNDLHHKEPSLCQVLAPPKFAVLPLFPLSPELQLGLLGDALSQEVILQTAT